MLQKNVGLYLGSFNPMTIGHEDILAQAAQSKLFDEILLCRGENPAKKDIKQYMPKEELREILEVYKTNNNIRGDVVEYSGLTTDFVGDLFYTNKENNYIIIRGLRSIDDFENEKFMLQTLRQIDPSIRIRVIYFMCNAQFANVSSSMVRGFIDIGAWDLVGKYKAPYDQDEWRD